MGWTANENVIEWMRGSDMAYITLSDQKQIARVYRLQEKNDKVVILKRPQENGGYLYAKIPVAFVRLFAPPKQSEAKREAARIQLARNKDANRRKNVENRRQHE